ncbi:MAG: orc1/cdc6 family replication initiation protein [Haloquadratum walsbyi J07HQW2]|uniref:ORC1-type DNA replication protein n=2 Tax=Haloquadratum walsbyi TaxID=293091 RepID=U1NK51_9EURY|nr:MAG: orc1/cdc6 family replication initiation protein [Haloquadratum walsbyi J07HQW2]
MATMTEYADIATIFQDDEVLTESWTPDDLPERDEEIEQLRSAFAPATRGAGADSVFLYGKAGQGKTATARVELDELHDHAENESDILDLSSFFISCEGLTTSFQVVDQIVYQLCGTHMNGMSIGVAFDRMYEEFNKIGGTIILVLDEIDNIGSDDDILYSVPRARSKNYVDDDVYPSVVGISNNLKWHSSLSPKVKDSLYDQSVHFAPYDANQLGSILRRRAEKAFVNMDVLGDDAIPLASAFAAQDKGSARQAINFLRKAAKLASENDEETVLEKHVRKAEDLIEKQRVEEGMSSLTTQGHLALAATTSLELAEKTPARTKDIYTVYKKLARRIESEVITMRRMRDHLNDLDMQGILIKTVSNTGPRGGKYFKFELSVEAETATDILSDITRFQDIDLRL